MFCQMWNCGRVSHESYQPDGALPPAPSAIACADGMAWTMEGPKVCRSRLTAAFFHVEAERHRKQTNARGLGLSVAAFSPLLGTA